VGDDRETARARSLAYRRLAARPRSRAELEGYLAGKEFPDNVIDPVIAEFSRKGYIDDRKFAYDYGRYLVESKGLSRFALRVELRKKGVSDEDIYTAIDALFAEEGYEEYDIALGAARKKAASIERLADRDKAKRRLADYLRRRGFSFDIIRKVMRDLL
jgi:regulatory protein